VLNRAFLTHQILPCAKRHVGKDLDREIGKRWARDGQEMDDEGYLERF
jgi:hypothetical protein